MHSHTTVPSVTVPPMVVGQLGSPESDVPAVVQTYQ